MEYYGNITEIFDYKLLLTRPARMKEEKCQGRQIYWEVYWVQRPSWPTRHLGSIRPSTTLAVDKNHMTNML